MRAIILVAGMGTRLKPLTDDMPKCLTEVGGRAILENALGALESNGINEVILVVGHLRNKIRERIGSKYGSMDVRYVVNDIYDKTNTSYSLLKAVRAIDKNEDMIVLEGDVFFEKALLRDFLSSGPTTSTIVQKYNSSLDGSFVALRDSTVVDWVHTCDRDEKFVIEDMYKTVNIHKFDGEFVKEHLRPVLEEYVERESGKAPMERVMRNIVAERGGVVAAFETASLKWFEIDGVADLDIAEKMFS